MTVNDLWGCQNPILIVWHLNRKTIDHGVLFIRCDLTCLPRPEQHSKFPSWNMNPYNHYGMLFYDERSTVQHVLPTLPQSFAEPDVLQKE